MSTFRKSQLFSLISGFSFLVVFVVLIIDDTICYINYGFFPNLGNLLFRISLIIYPICIFQRKENIWLVIAAGLQLAHILLFLSHGYFQLSNILYLIVRLLTFLCLIYSCVPALEEKAPMFRKLCFLPGVLYIFYELYIWFGPSGAASWPYWQLYLVGYIAEPLALITMGLWIRNDTPQNLQDVMTPQIF